MIKTGLVSVTFRQLSVEEVVKTAKEAGLEGIEWGADVHVPAGDIAAAEKARKITEDAGLSVFAYGSYFRPGECKDAAEEFKPVLDSAVALGAPLIRVWAGAKWSWYADEAYSNKVIDDTKIICDMAAEKNIKISYEYHGWSLTDNRFSAVDAWDRVKKDNMSLYWQPNFGLSTEENCLALKMIMPHMDYVHVFYWAPDGEKLPMADGLDVWKKFADILKSDGKDHCVMMEFVKDGAVEQLFDDVRALKTIL